MILNGKEIVGMKISLFEFEYNTKWIKNLLIFCLTIAAQSIL